MNKYNYVCLNKDCDVNRTSITKEKESTEKCPGCKKKLKWVGMGTPGIKTSDHNFIKK